MNKFFQAFFISGVLFTAPARANSLIEFPQGDMACTITVSDGTVDSSGSKSSSSSQPSKPAGLASIKTIEVTRVGHLRRDIATWTDGSTSETWTLTDLGMTLVERDMGPSKIIIPFPRSSGARNAFAPVLLEFDKNSTAWIRPETRLPPEPALASFQGRSWIHYQATVESPESMQSIRHVLYQAWVDPKTQIPAALNDGDHLYELTFAPKPPTEQLVLPDRFKVKLQHYQNANATIRHL